MNQESEPQNTSPKSGSSSPTIIQALIWGFFAAMFGSIFAWLGKTLSENPVAPQPPDSLHGQSSLLEMHKYVDSVLAAAPDALKHDQNFLGTVGICVGALCLLALAAAALFIVKTRKIPITSFGLRFTRIAICGLALTTFGLTIVMKVKEDGLLHGASILAAIANPNTDPSVIIPGQSVTIEVPTGLQSFQGSYKSVSYKITSSEAELLDGSTIPVRPGNYRIIEQVGEKRGKTDVIPEMENVKARLIATLPADPKLTDALVKVSVVGELALIASDQNDFSGAYPFEATTSLRLAGDRENQFYADYNHLTTRLTHLLLISLATAAIAIIAICVFRAKAPAIASAPKSATSIEI